MVSNKRQGDQGDSPEPKRQLIGRALDDEMKASPKPKSLTPKPGPPKESAVKGGQYYMVQRLNVAITRDSTLTQWPGIVCDDEAHAYFFLGKRLYLCNSEQAFKSTGHFIEGRLNKPEAAAVPVILLSIKQAVVDDATVNILKHPDHGYPDEFVKACDLMLKKGKLEDHYPRLKELSVPQASSGGRKNGTQATGYDGSVPQVVVPHVTQTAPGTSGRPSKTPGDSERSTSVESSLQQRGSHEPSLSATTATHAGERTSPDAVESSDDEGKHIVKAPPIMSNDAAATHVSRSASIQSAGVKSEHGVVKKEVSDHHGMKEAQAKGDDLVLGGDAPSDGIFKGPPCSESQVRIFLKGGVQKLVERKHVEKSTFLNKKLEKHVERGEWYIKSYTLEQISGEEFIPFLQFFQWEDFKPFLDESDPEGPEILGFELGNSKKCADLAAKCNRLCLLASPLELTGLEQKAFAKLKLLLPYCSQSSTEFVKNMRLISFGGDIDNKVWCAEYVSKHFYSLLEQSSNLLNTLQSDKDFAKMVYRLMADLPGVDPKEMKKLKSRSKKAGSRSGGARSTPGSAAKATPTKSTPTKATPSKHMTNKAPSTPSKSASKKSAASINVTPSAKSSATKKHPVKAKIIKPTPIQSAQPQSDDEEESDEEEEESEEE